MPLYYIAEVAGSSTGVGFTADQITSISNALSGLANNVISMFISLLPAMVVIGGVSFGIAFVLRLMNRAKRAR